MKKFIFLLEKVWGLLYSLAKHLEKQSIRIIEQKKKEKSGEKSHKKPNDLLSQVESFLLEHYQFRFNSLTEVTEFRKKNREEKFRPVCQREMNSLCIEARIRGIDCWDRDVSRYIHSAHISSYHPFEEYMANLPVWDGKDRVRSLAQRVSDLPLWIDGFHRWMLALTAQWLNMEQTFANSVAPVLVSRRQGKHKSTFCKMLLPSELQIYYTDSFDITAVSGAEQKLALFGLINLDEMDKFNARKMALLKNLMQMASLAIRKPHKKQYSSLPRIASFIATSNQKELLTDPTGSRRFLCVEVEKMIDCTPIDHKQLYAQLKEELESGVRHWFTPEEENQIMVNNAPFQKRGMEFDVFYIHYRPAINGEGEQLSAAAIFNQLKKKNPAAMREVSAANFGKVLTALGLEKVHTEKGNFYRVVPVKN